LAPPATGTAPNFGRLGAATQVDPGVLSGWGVRPGDHQYTVTLQHELLPRVSVDGAYTHRSFHGFFVTDDLTRRGNINSYYETYTLTAPTDSRLPDGGGYPITVFVPTAAANAIAPRLFMSRESDYGPERDSLFDSVGFNVNARMRNGLTVQFGGGTGRGKVNTCETATKFNNVNAATGAIAGPDPRGCNNVEPWQASWRGLATYTIPKVEVQVTATVRSQPPALLAATALTTAQWQVPNSVIAGALGHLPPGATATGTTTIPIGHNDRRIYADERRNQVDMRIAKILRFRRTRANLGVDLNNLLNSNYATGFATTYIYNTDNTPRPSGWGTPTSIYYPRFVRVNYTLNF
jgi:hypothetical protein